MLPEAGGFDPDDGGGGFMEDDGGFIAEDDAGGFVADDGDGSTEDDAPSPRLSAEGNDGASPARIPLHALPKILASLGLPNDDDVLGVFRSSASGWHDDDPLTSRRKRDDGGEPGVKSKDFRAVCAALMEPDEGGEGSGSDEEAEDAYRLPSGEESSLSSLSESDYEGKPVRPRRTGSPKTRSSRSRKALEANTDRPKLTSHQKEVVRDMWDMLRPKAKDGGRGSSILGREEVKHWVRTLGEMWTEEEVSDIVA